MKNLQDVQNHSQFDNFEFIARQIVEGFITGLHRSPFHGFSVEFAEHRLYNSGESTKHIDWRLFAKTDKLFVKRYEEETNLRCQIVIDTSSSMLFPFNDSKLDSKLAFSLYSAAALIYMLRKQRDAVGLSLFDSKLELHTPAKLSQVHAQMLFSELNKVFSNNNSKESFNKTTSLAEVLHQISDSIHQRSLVIIFSDFFENSNPEELHAALQHLRYNKHEVIIFNVNEPDAEENFAFPNRPLKVTDMESGETIKVNPNQVRAFYKENVSKITNDLRLKCAQYQIEYKKADIKNGFNQVLIEYLVKRNKLF